jgi:hypothetical protein
MRHFEAEAILREELEIHFVKFVKVFRKLFGSAQHPVSAFYSSLNPLGSSRQLNA